MNTNKAYIAFLLLVLLFSACKKDDLPPDDIGPTVFGIVGTIDNKPVTIEAGIDRYYMYTSYNYDVNDSVYTFTGELKPTDCDSGCFNTLTISIRNYKKGNNPIDISALIKPGQLNYRKISSIVTVPSDSIRLKFTAEPEGSAPFTQLWEFQGFGTSGADTTSIIVPLSNSVVLVCLTVTDSKSATGSVCDTINTQSNNNCTANFSVAYASSFNDSVVFQPLSSVNNHFWEFGDGQSKSTSGGGSVSHIYTGADSNSTYTVRLTSDDGAGCTQTITKTLRFEAIPANPLANYSYKFITLPPQTIIDSADLSQVTITWVNENGVTYTSRNDDQPSNSTFEILETEPYANNEKGEKTYKFTARVNCRLYNGISFIEVKNAIVKFAVAYP